MSQDKYTRSAKNKPCTVLKLHPNVKNITGHRFGRALVKLPIGRAKNRSIIWLCLCDCGVEFSVLSSSLVCGRTKSCGCLQRELVSKRMTKHGLINLPEYKVWCGIKARTGIKSATGYKYYGGIGIKLCKRWEKFDNFYHDMGSRPSPLHSIDRINNDGDYTPENCKWSTRTQQNRNSRHNNKILFEGKESCLSEISEITGVHARTIFDRLNSGMSIDMATKKIDYRKKK